MTMYAQIAAKIIKAQEAIIGPVAVEQAARVNSLSIDWDKQQVAIRGDEVQAIDDLVGVYKQLFGQVSVEVSKEAVSSLIGQLGTDKLPEALK